MNIEEVRDYCLKLKNAEESFPFGEDTLVFKVEGKMFLAMSRNGENSAKTEKYRQFVQLAKSLLRQFKD